MHHVDTFYQDATGVWGWQCFTEGCRQEAIVGTLVQAEGGAQRHRGETGSTVVYIVEKGAYDDRYIVCAGKTREDAERIAERLGGEDADAFVIPVAVHPGNVRIVSVLEVVVDVFPSRGTQNEREWINTTTPEHVQPHEDVPCQWQWRRYRSRHRQEFWSLRAWGTEHDLIQQVVDSIREKLATDPEYRDRDEMTGGS